MNHHCKSEVSGLSCISILKRHVNDNIFFEQNQVRDPIFKKQYLIVSVVPNLYWWNYGVKIWMMMTSG